MFDIYLDSITLQAFLFQSIFLTAPIPLSYIAYYILSRSRKQELDTAALHDLGLTSQEIKMHHIRPDKYSWREFVMPVFFATLLTFLAFSISHPYSIKTLGLWTGFIEEVVNIFGGDSNEAIRDIFVGRFLFYAFFGSYLYAVSLIYKRYLSLDLTPNVYIYTSLRFITALFIGNMVGMGLGVFNQSMGFDKNLMIVSLVAFFIGFFPERGLFWIVNVAQRVLGQTGKISNETPLHKLEGMSIWVQGRLKQENIENVQSLATVDIPELVVNAPFSVTQIIDWIDQAILIIHANDMYKHLEAVGIRSASDLVTVEKQAKLPKLATALSTIPNPSDPLINEAILNMLLISVKASRNVQITTHYRWKYNVDGDLRNAIGELDPFPDSVNTLDEPTVEPKLSGQLLPSTD
jgi:hypothetical protein